ncbi:MAG: putative metalloprotease CJM1_0395 family protein [Campylobacter sp.]|uniref:putative metalloprotease CJM1_0395 family protein n=1 Tax=Campylobacter sp. TaxID=205 RepID=UPI0029718E1B|nr:putative metalloprotease CJM1_0395 family protein [Campylobacter sp.]MDD7600417.1 putative metalloprotease CJM1_0395 family protein [Campylobacteraceae bacterium]MDY5888456.1 putative metalloprotease CJM1_0395 family protein [Campylobacter sp.]
MQITSYAMNYYNTPAQSNDRGVENNTGNSSGDKTSSAKNNTQNNDKNAGQKNIGELSREEQRIVSELQAADTNVRAHEAAHMAAGGGLTSPASYTYEQGPDNKMYAVAGEVGISTSEGNTPQESLNKAQTIRRAALAPADPSPQDLKVAAQAASMEMSARAEILQEKMAQNSQNSNNSNEASAGNSNVNSNTNSAGNSNVNSTENSRIPSINQPSSTGGYYAAISDPTISSQIASSNQKSVIGAGVDLAALIG